jgi:putative acyl-CoA dehydrogenase
MKEFFQDPPQLKNQYEEDALLKSFLKRNCPKAMLLEIEPELKKLGERAIGEILELGKLAQGQPPKHIPYDPWGNRIDEIQVSEAWNRLGEIATEEGLVATPYENRHKEFSRIHQFARSYLYGPSSAIYTCPLAMTDGAAKLLSLIGSEELKKTAFPNLISRNIKNAWTSGQWMTERTGGSDVSQTGTVAKKEKGEFRLYGTKWFTSATTSQIALTLAHIEGDVAGSKGLSLFYVKLRDGSGRLQNIRIHRLKDKLGTKALPTAELTLDGTPATLVGTQGEGIKKISPVLNITRIWNSCMAVGFMRRGIALSKDYSQKRKAFGKTLAHQPLHAKTLASLEAEFQGAFHLVFFVIRLLGKEENQVATPNELSILRLLTPVTKLYTGKQAIAVSSEALESFGGAGYVEDAGLPELLRDSQVLSIWEGTTNILSLDTLKVVQKGALTPLFEEFSKILSGIKNQKLSIEIDLLKNKLKEIQNYFHAHAGVTPAVSEASAREASFLIAELSIGILLVDHAAWSEGQNGNESFFAAASYWCGRKIRIPDSLTLQDLKLFETLSRP